MKHYNTNILVTGTCSSCFGMIIVCLCECVCVCVCMCVLNSADIIYRFLRVVNQPFLLTSPKVTCLHCWS